MEKKHEGVSILDNVHEEIGKWKQQTYGILRTYFSDADIDNLCAIFDHPPDVDMIQVLESSSLVESLCQRIRASKNIRKHVRDNIKNLIVYPTVALVLFRWLERNLPPKKSSVVMPGEELANLIQVTINAFVALNNASGESSRLLAMHSLRSRKRQPPTRNRTNPERDEIELEFNAYRTATTKKLTTRGFIKYLENNGYSVDRAKGDYGIIEKKGEWNRAISLNTLKKWFYEIK